MQPPSPFEPPKADLVTTPVYAELNWTTRNGRIGRLRYLAWTFVFMLVGFPITLALLKVVYSLNAAVSLLLLGTVGVAALVVGVRICAQRLHDIGWSAWWLLLYLVPLGNNIFALVMLVMPGDPGRNRFGPPPPPNNTAVKLLAVLGLAAFIGLFLLAVLADLPSLLR
ncbi:DUF805 domain-containing protein [Pseudomonas typographi]|uniref:DUF805 domain-containing protein n=1 Tax=Pseudomonas typographi TaxID=2715964 RepID=UPI001682F472|nr:DUF805 domain-containing protein [Pseudomonas typographi]MBD1552086.1 DUF805 domain-containing protein [Pseudomonas typographi]